MNNQKIAEQITTGLFVMGQGQQARRLVLELPDGSAGGGWGRPAVLKKISQGIQPLLDRIAELESALTGSPAAVAAAQDAFNLVSVMEAISGGGGGKGEKE